MGGWVGCCGWVAEEAGIKANSAPNWVEVGAELGKNVFPPEELSYTTQIALEGY